MDSVQSLSFVSFFRFEFQKPGRPVQNGHCPFQKSVARFKSGVAAFKSGVAAFKSAPAGFKSGLSLSKRRSPHSNRGSPGSNPASPGSKRGLPRSNRPSPISNRAFRFHLSSSSRKRKAAGFIFNVKMRKPAFADRDTTFRPRAPSSRCPHKQRWRNRRLRCSPDRL